MYKHVILHVINNCITSATFLQISDRIYQDISYTARTWRSVQNDISHNTVRYNHQCCCNDLVVWHHKQYQEWCHYDLPVWHHKHSVYFLTETGSHFIYIHMLQKERLWNLHLIYCITQWNTRTILPVLKDHLLPDGTWSQWTGGLSERIVFNRD